MVDRVIIDAGPVLNFFSINKERVLTEVVGRLSVPETVQKEVYRKAETDKRFERVKLTFDKTLGGYIDILSEKFDDELVQTFERISGSRFQKRLKQPKNLGELMAITFAVDHAESGTLVYLIIDDQDGVRLARKEERRLDRLRKAGKSVGRIYILGTCSVLEKAAGGRSIPDKKEMQKIYSRLRAQDDGLPPIRQTNLLKPICWD